MNNITKLDNNMQKYYKKAKNNIVDIYPFITFEGKGIYKLYLNKDTFKEFNQLDDIKKFFDFSKAISHIIVLLNSALLNNNWKKILISEKKMIDNILKSLPNILNNLNNIYLMRSYDNIKIPFYKKPTKIIEIAKNILLNSNEFINNVLKKDTYTLNDYKKFSNKYSKDFINFSYNIFYTNEGRSYLVLNKWKKSMSKNDWNKLFIVDTVGSPSGKGIGGNIRGNCHYSPVSIHMKYLMDKDKHTKNIISAPDLNNVKDIIRDVKLSNFLANNTFYNDELYNAIVTPSSTLGGNFINRIVKHISKNKHKYY